VGSGGASSFLAEHSSAEDDLDPTLCPPLAATHKLLLAAPYHGVLLLEWRGGCPATGVAGGGGEDEGRGREEKGRGRRLQGLGSTRGDRRAASRVSAVGFLFYTTTVKNGWRRFIEGKILGLRDANLCEAPMGGIIYTPGLRWQKNCGRFFSSLQPGYYMLSTQCVSLSGATIQGDNLTRF
jgi:hypothetical protein